MEKYHDPMGIEAEQSLFISEKAFLRIVAPFTRPLLGLAAHHQSVLDKKGRLRIYPMGFLARVIKDASDVENLLDRYDAATNLEWVYFREFTASLKNFGKASFLLEELHWATRFDNLCGDLLNLEIEALPMRMFFTDVISKCFRLLGEEAARLGLSAPEEAPASGYGVRVEAGRRLPHSIEQTAHWDALKIASRIAYRFVELIEADAALLQKAVDDKGNSTVAVYAPLSLNEGQTRRLATLVHNLVSWYDSYLKNHTIQEEFKSLPVLRRMLSCLLSLLKIATILLHFYERHLLGWPPSAANLREVIPPGRLLDEVLFTVLVWSGRLFRSGKETAAGLLHIFVDTAVYELPIPMDMGFHARPSTLVARIVQHHGAEVRMHVDDQVFNAGNIMEMLSAGGYIVTKGLHEVIFRGDKTALDDLRILAKANYGETRDGKAAPLPEKLRYLEGNKASRRNDETPR